MMLIISLAKPVTVVTKAAGMSVSCHNYYPISQFTLTSDDLLLMLFLTPALEMFAANRSEARYSDTTYLPNPYQP
jgi:hypothetical protein